MEPFDDRPERGNETVLVAEDDETLRTLACSVLGEFGYTVIPAEDGNEATAKFSANRDIIDLVVLDMLMPGKNGKEVCDEIRSIKPAIKVLFTSGCTADIVHERGVPEPGVDFAMKPLSPLDLLRRIRKLLDG